MSRITKEFLERALGQQVIEFETSSGSKLGDGFTSLLFSIKVTVQDKNSSTKSLRNLILKCYPDQLYWHEFLKLSNCFYREIAVYNIFTPELLQLSKSEIDSPFPDFVFGDAVDYSVYSSAESMPACENPLENCLVLPNLRSEDNGGYHMADRRTILDIDHLNLIIAQYAKLHALSWVYKQRNGCTLLSEKFPFLKGSFLDSMTEEEEDKMMDGAIEPFLAVVEDCVKDPEEKEKFIQSIKKFKEKIGDTVTLYFSDREDRPKPSYTKENLLRIPLQPSAENEDQWLVALHGDAKIANMLFRYIQSEDGREKPVEVKFIDLQFAREGDPITDLEYIIYTTTDSECRKKYMDTLLQLYTGTFLRICKDLEVAPPPGFELSEVKRRFQRGKTFGFFMTLIVLPAFLADFEKDEGMNWTEMDKDASYEETLEAFKEIGRKVEKSPLFQGRVLDVVKEFYEEGII